MRQLVVRLLLVSLAAMPAVAAGPDTSEIGRLAPPASLPELAAELRVAPGTSYDPEVPMPEEILGFPLGARAATPEEITRAVETWSSHPRVEVVEYARTWEGRPLHYVVVTSETNQGRLAEVKAGMARLADPRGSKAGEADRLVDELPGVAWLGYSIHGNETSGSDAALVVLHHLIAGTEPEVTGLLDELVVIIDPMMNPDGRARFAQQAAQYRGAAPNLDDQSLLRRGSWPWGRGNHYLFDLNRDWTLGVHPESRGRIRAVSEWHPLLLVDAHEMGSQDTYLFSPQREPRNPHTPESRGRWNDVFARDQASAFDRRGWAYYTGEWNEGWYPGYSDAWAMFRGAVGILYEQAQVGEDGVRRPSGEILTYREAVEHQAVSSLANLETLRRHRGELLRDFLAERRRAVASSGPYADRTFAVLPTANRARFQGFVELMQLQGFELYQTSRSVEVSAADAFGRTERRTLPAGTLLVPNRQPDAPLVATMLELDRPLPPGYVERERRELLRHGSSTIYDLTAWSAPLLHGLETVVLSTHLPAGSVAYEPPSPSLPPEDAADAVAWVYDGADDASVALAARLLERDFEARLATRDFELDGRRFSAGSLVVPRFDQPGRWSEATAAVKEIAAELGTTAVPVTTGLGTGELPDLGGDHFARLERPRIALLAQGRFSTYDFGTTWFLLDRELGVRHSHLGEDGLSFADLRRYNVLVLPDRWSGSFESNQIEALETWVESGGTLIAVGGSADALAKEEGGLSRTRTLASVLEELDRYEAAVLGEHAASTVATPAANELWSHRAPATVDYPWPAEPPARPGKDEIERREAWQSTFMPSGAILAGRVDTEHWLTFGTPEILPLLTGRQPVLMSAPPVETPVRFGVLRPGEGDGSTRVGWSLLPDGHAMDLRLGGLLWPEAAHRLASSAWVTRESKGKGQIILFASSPTFRASTPATARLLLNALVYGPGLGANAAPIEP